MENWKAVKGYEGLYEVSDCGRVRGIKSGRVLSVNRLNAHGYNHVSLRKNGKAKEYLAHRLVMENFGCGEPKETVNHIDGCKTNNHIGNLEWATRSEQMYHAYEKKLKKPVGRYKLTDEQVEEIKATYQRYKKGFGSVALAAKYGVESTTILRIVNGGR